MGSVALRRATMDDARIAVAQRIALGFGRARDLMEVTDFAAASATYRAEVGASGCGYSTMPQGWVYDLGGPTPRRIARVSYNGRVWALGDDETLLFDPSTRTAP